MEYCLFMAKSWLDQLFTSDICTNCVVNPSVVGIFLEWSDMLLKSLISFMLWCGWGRCLTFPGHFPSCTISRYPNYWAISSCKYFFFPLDPPCCLLLIEGHLTLWTLASLPVGCTVNLECIHTCAKEMYQHAWTTTTGSHRGHYQLDIIQTESAFILKPSSYWTTVSHAHFEFCHQEWLGYRFILMSLY